MAHKKASGTKARQGGNRAGKRLGLKTNTGELVRTGAILVRQIGTKVGSGRNVGVGKDHTLFALLDGTVKFEVKASKQLINVDPASVPSN